MSPRQAKLLGLLAIVICSAVVIYRGKGFDPRRLASIAILGSAVLFLSSFSPQISGLSSGLLIADCLVLSKGGSGVINGLGKTVLSGASTASTSGPGGVPQSSGVGGPSTIPIPGATAGAGTTLTPSGIQRIKGDVPTNPILNV